MASPTRAGNAGSLPAPESVYSVYRGLMGLGCVDKSAGTAGTRSADAELGGKLVLYDTLNLAGSATALAASIAGAASLGIDPDVERLKQAVRNGVCDFVVNGLDEAVRILKNEIRKKNAVAVGLAADVAACLAEIVERGLQPDVLAFAAGGADRGVVDSSLDILKQRGARSLGRDGSSSLNLRLPKDRDKRELKFSDLLSLAEVRWSVPDSPARWLPKLSGIAADVLARRSPAGDNRLRWLRLLPRYFPRAAYHFVPMDDPELEQFLSAVREQTASGAIATMVTVACEQALNPGRIEVFSPCV